MATFGPAEPQRQRLLLTPALDRSEAERRALSSVFLCNARFPLGPSALAFALNSHGSILNGTGPALRGLAGR
jgi:hypothetical protein